MGLGIPVLAMEWDNFDTRVYKHVQYKSQPEIFRGMVESNKKK